MAAIVLPDKWVILPTYPVKPNFNHGLFNQCLIAKAAFPNVWVDLFKGGPSAISTTTVLEPRSGMWVVSSDATSTGIVDLGNLDVPTAEISLIGLLSANATSSTDQLLSSRASTGNGIGILFGSGVLGGLFEDSDGTNRYTSTIARTNYVISPFALTCDATTGNFYLGGGVATPGSGTFTSTSLSGSQNLHLGKRGTSYRAGSLGLILAHNRVISLDEYNDWRAAPWQIFQPDKRILYFSVGGGATTVSPGSGSITATGYAPSISQTHTVSPAAGAVAALGYAPTIAQPHTVAPSAGAATVLGYAPSIQQAAGIYPGAGAVEYAGQTPTISQPHTVSPGVGAYDILGYAPTVSQAAGVAPLAGSIIVLGYAPAISQPITVAPGAGAAAWLGQPPTISQSTPLFTQEQLDYLLAYMEANMAVPTAAQIAAAVWAEVLEGTLTAAQMQRIKLAALAGKRQGLGTVTEEYLGLDGITPRVTFTPTDASGNGVTVVDGA